MGRGESSSRKSKWLEGLSVTILVCLFRHLTLNEGEVDGRRELWLNEGTGGIERKGKEKEKTRKRSSICPAAATELDEWLSC